jgi:hypothetical protein
MEWSLGYDRKIKVPSKSRCGAMKMHTYAKAPNAEIGLNVAAFPCLVTSRYELEYTYITYYMYIFIGKYCLFLCTMIISYKEATILFTFNSFLFPFSVLLPISLLKEKKITMLKRYGNDKNDNNNNDNKRPMGHIAHLSSLGPYRNILPILDMYFIPICPIQLSRAHDFNKLAFVLCRKAFM